ncbi:MAG: FKBP-type peptidyl-prolyl cis-trans isomerase [Planctomycetota bacterium]|nr:FKBP-type peptidyl-prolyl cis-trans isomerase [Planctomycetota bacterium]
MTIRPPRTPAWIPARIVPLLALLATGSASAQGVEQLAPPTAEASAEDMGYALGFQIGQQILADQRQISSPVDQASLAAGLSDAITIGKPKLDEARFRAAMTALEVAMRRKQQELLERMRASAKANLEKGTAYLAAKAVEKGVTALPGGLLYEVLKEGDGAKPGAKDVVVARYSGKHIDGRVFDATDPAGEPVSFPLPDVVPAWQQALPLMKAGSTWRIHVPPSLGYGEEGSPPAIEPNEVLVFEIELVGSRPQP